MADEDIERARKLIGFEEAVRHRGYVQTATYDAIRNFAVRGGNDNPLHCDPDYARRTRWGDVIAPGMMAGIINAPMRGDLVPDEIRALRKSLFRGIHVFVSGSSWDWYRPVYPGDRLYSFRGLESVEVKQSEFAGRSVIQVHRDVKVNQRSEVVAVYRILQVLTERKTAAKKGKYATIKPATYTDEEIAAIDAVYEAEQVRGTETRCFEDVAVGESLGKMAKGPLTVSDVICFHAGGYGFVPYTPTVGRLAYKNRKRIPAFYIKNEYGVPDVAQRLHWDPTWAQAIGNPMTYDYGVMRENSLAFGYDPVILFALGWLERNIPPEPERAVIVHGDAGPGNFLFHEGRVTALLDWELVHYGDPMADLAMLCQRTGRAGIENYDFYIAFNFFRLAAIFHGIKGRVIRGTAASVHAQERARSFPALARLAREAMELCG